MEDILYAYHLANTSENTVENWTSRGNMTKNEAKYLRTAITYTNKFLQECMLRLDDKERKKVLQRTIKASKKPIIIIDEWMKRRILGPYEKEMEVVKIERTNFEKVALLAMKTVCEDCTNHFSSCEFYDILENNLIPRSEKEKNCPYCFLSTEKELERQENLRKLEEEKRIIKANKSKRKQKKQKNRYDEDEDLIEYNFKTKYIK